MRAFVLSGGASLGSVQVGMARALYERGITPDLIVGASAGAINGVYLAGNSSLAGIDALAGIWRGLSRQRVFPARPFVGLSGFLGRATHLVPNGEMRKLLDRHLPVARLEDAPVDVHVVVTELMSGHEVALSHGPAHAAVLASASIPGVFPPVEIDGRLFVDGGIANNTPISHAVDAGADEVWVLPAGFSCALGKPPVSALAVAMQSLNLLVHGRLGHDIRLYAERTDLRVLPPLCPLGVGPTDFGHADRLMADAYASTLQWLAQPADAQRLSAVNLHHHPPFVIH